MVGALFQFIDHGDRIVFHQDAALAVRGGDQLVGADTGFSGARAGLDVRGRRDAGPVDVRLAQRPVRRLSCSIEAEGLLSRLHGQRNGDRVFATPRY